MLYCIKCENTNPFNIQDPSRLKGNVIGQVVVNFIEFTMLFCGLFANKYPTFTFPLIVEIQSLCECTVQSLVVVALC